MLTNPPVPSILIFPYFVCFQPGEGHSKSPLHDCENRWTVCSSSCKCLLDTTPDTVINLSKFLELCCCRPRIICHSSRVLTRVTALVITHLQHSKFYIKYCELKPLPPGVSEGKREKYSRSDCDRSPVGKKPPLCIFVNFNFGLA